MPIATSSRRGKSCVVDGRTPGLSKENLEANRPFADRMRSGRERRAPRPRRSRSRGCSRASLGPFRVPGARRIDHLEENLGAIKLDLTSADMASMDAALAKLEVHGERMDAKNTEAIDYTGRSRRRRNRLRKHEHEASDMRFTRRVAGLQQRR
jgi:hypothetical protein